MVRWCWGCTSHPSRGGNAGARRTHGRAPSPCSKESCKSGAGCLEAPAPSTLGRWVWPGCWVVSGASTRLQASFQWSHHTKTDMRITQRHGLHSTPRVSTNAPSADTTGLPQPAPGTSPRRFSPPQSQAPSVWPLPSWPSSCSPGARLGGHPGPCTRWLPRASYSETFPSGNSGSWD